MVSSLPLNYINVIWYCFKKKFDFEAIIAVVIYPPPQKKKKNEKENSTHLSSSRWIMAAENSLGPGDQLKKNNPDLWGNSTQGSAKLSFNVGLQL